jgi:ketosteroid isomerase-like protein
MYATQTDQRPADLESVVRKLYSAWPQGDRATLESIIADEFRFTSPYDDAIDRATFFSRCWPNHVNMKTFSLRRISVDGDHVYVTYRLELKDGRHIENTELLRFRGHHLVACDVYFGAERDADGRFKAMKQPS